MAIGSVSSLAVIKLKAALAMRESSNNQYAVNSIGYLGKYQFGAAALEDTGYIRTGASKDGNKALNNPSNWTGKDGIFNKNNFLNSEQAQENAMDNLLERNYRTGKRLRVITDNDTEERLAGYLAAAHIGGPGNAAKYLKGNKGFTDAYGTSISEYVELGINAVRIA